MHTMGYKQKHKHASAAITNNKELLITQNSFTSLLVGLCKRVS